VRKNNRNISWWSLDLAERRKKVHRLFNLAKKSQNWNDFKRTLMNYKKAPRENHGGHTVRRLRRLQNVPDSTGFSQRTGRVQ